MDVLREDEWEPGYHVRGPLFVVPMGPFDPFQGGGNKCLPMSAEAAGPALKRSVTGSDSGI